MAGAGAEHSGRHRPCQSPGAGALRNYGAVRGPDRRANPHRRRYFPRVLLPDSAGGLCGRSESHVADRRGRALLKLNTNENPYPPAPAVLKAIRAAVDGRLRLYPNPTAQRLREKLADLHGCGPENLIIGNGSDELLALATRAFGDPGRSRLQY